MFRLLFLAALPIAAQYSGAIDAPSSSGVGVETNAPQWPSAVIGHASGGIEMGTRAGVIPARQFKLSLASLLAANALDAVSSRGGYELNPILGRGNFGAHQEAIKGAFVGALVVGELLVVRRWPRSARAFMWCNFAGAGVTASMAARNLEVIR